MEQDEKAPEKPQRNRVIIRSPIRLAIFSAAILMLAAMAMRMISEASPMMSAALY